MRKLGLIAFAAAALMSAPALAAVDFSGKRIEIIVPYEAGGGTDLYVRFLAPLLSEKLPGQPTVIVTNIPGAGAIAGGNQFQQRAKPNGLTLIGIGTSLTANFAMRDTRVKYKLDEWIPIIGSPSGTVVYGHSSLGLKGPEDIGLAKDKKLIMGANNPTGGDMRVLLSLDTLGLDVQGVFGLNRGDVRPAFERGEFNINFDTTAAYQVQTVPLVTAGSAVPLFTLGMWEPGDKIVRDPLLPEIPSYAEVYRKLHGKDPEGDAYKAWLAVYKLNFLLALGLDLPAGTPREIVDTYHQAIKEVVAEFDNPKYAEQAKKIVGPYKQVIGADAERSLQDAADFPDGTYEWLQTWLKAKFNQGK